MITKAKCGTKVIEGYFARCLQTCLKDESMMESSAALHYYYYYYFLFLLFFALIRFLLRGKEFLKDNNVMNLSARFREK